MKDDRVSYLCRNLKLSIKWIHSNQLRLTLADDLSLDQIELDLEVSEPRLVGGSRSYQNREAIIIGMRRLINQALKAGLISDSPGALTSSSLDGGVVAPMISTTDEAYLLQS